MVLCATINYSFLYSSLLQLFELLLDTYQGTLLPPLKDVHHMEGTVRHRKVIRLLRSHYRIYFGIYK